MATRRSRDLSWSTGGAGVSTGPSSALGADAPLRAAQVRAVTARQLSAGRVGRVILWLWMTLLAAWFAAVLIGIVPALLALPVGLLGSLRAERRWAAAMATRALADSFAAITLGRLVEAEAALDALAASSWIPTATRRLIAIQRGLVAVRRGDVRAARAPLDEAIALPPARDEPDAAYQRAGALALRAFALASSGAHDEALADVAAVRASAAASEDARARASLAEALVLERRGEREALRELLARDRRLLREATHPRERAIARALERLARTPRVTPYRVVESSVESGDEPTVETWLARVAPGLASFAEPRRARGEAPDLAAPAPTERGIAAVRASRIGGGAPMWPLVLLAFGAFGGLAWLMTGAGIGAPMHADVGAPAAGGSVSLPDVVLLAVLSGAGFGLGSKWLRRRKQRLRLASVRAGGDVEAAADELRALTRGEDDASAAQAHLLLADRAEREGRWADVLADAEAGLVRVATPAARGATGLLAPDLIGLRAFALAVVGRTDEAEAELASIARGYPHYPRALFRVRLVQLVRAGRLADAAAHVESVAADLPLSLREELLADLVRAVAAPGGVTRAEAVRLADELAEDEGLRPWILGVAPGVLARFEGTDQVEDAAALEAAGPRIAVDPAASQAGSDLAAAPALAPGPAAAAADPEVDAEAEAEAAAALHQGSSSASMARRTS